MPSKPPIFLMDFQKTYIARHQLMTMRQLILINIDFKSHTYQGRKKSISIAFLPVYVIRGD